MFTGRLIGNRIMVWDVEESQQLYKMGFFGKPLGVHKPKNGEFNAPIVLDVIEGLYLVERKILKVLDENSLEIFIENLVKICKKEYKDFDKKYAVYKDLRDKKHIALPGIKFGCDFAVYKHGPGIDHAPYLVQVMSNHDKISATYVVLSGRLATTVRKQFIIAVVGEDNVPRYLAFEWWKS
ncbi:MAG: tRNA-intron lyase [Nitrososphaeria archaeon]